MGIYVYGDGGGVGEAGVVRGAARAGGTGGLHQGIYGYLYIYINI